MSDALIVFAKVPAAGRVKTRLMPELSGQEAADLYEAFLLDALDTYAALDADVRLYVAPSSSRLDPSLVRGGVRTYEQRGKNLGERMAHAFIDTFAAGYDRVAIIGTDHPTLPPAFVGYAFASLESPRSAAIGPAEDGGYYLLAMNDFVPQAFAGMTYSHVNVFGEALDRITSAGVATTVLPQWYDVDTTEELRRLCAELLESGELAPRTKQQIERLAARYEWLCA